MIFDDPPKNDEEPPSPYVDAHTHSWSENDGVIRIRNLFPGDILNPDDVPDQFSIGIHPSHLDGLTADHELSEIENILSRCKPVAIGECGLDHYSIYPMDLQEAVFLKQVKLAVRYELPLVIHAVRAWHEIIRIKNKYAKDDLWLAHGFRSSRQTAEELVKHNIVLSFGEALLHDDRTRDIFRDLDEDEFMLETDESVLEISQLYRVAAGLRGVSIDELRKTIYRTYKRVFADERP